MLKWFFYICAAVGFLDFLFALVMLVIVLVDKWKNRNGRYYTEE